MSDDTKAQIARVIFESIANGEDVSEKQRASLIQFLRGDKLPLEEIEARASHEHELVAQDKPTHTADELRAHVNEVETDALRCWQKTCAMLRAGADAMDERAFLIIQRAKWEKTANEAEARVKVLEEALLCADKLAAASAQLTVIDFDKSEKDQQMHNMIFSTQVVVCINEYRAARAALEKPAGLGWKLSDEAKKDIAEIERHEQWG
jgi:hypothetical protein